MNSSNHPSCLIPPRRELRVAFLGLSLSALLFAPLVFGATTDIAAVYSATGNGYQRVKLSDGSFKPETYTFAEGGRWDGLAVDKSLDDLSFLKVAHVISGALTQANFVMSSDPKTTQLMVLVFWGTTTGAEGGRYRNHQAEVFAALNDLNGFDRTLGSVERISSQGNTAEPWPMGDPRGMMKQDAIDRLGMALMINEAENSMRERNNSRNAVILGFWDDYNKARDLPTFAFSNSIIEELEANRYFVVLKVYDFQELRQHKTKRLLWESRFSIRERNNRFDEVLPVMALRALKWFGQDSKHLLREVVPIGRVDVGTPRVVEHPGEQK